MEKFLPDAWRSMNNVSIMELLSECPLRFNRIPADIAVALADSASLPLEDEVPARCGIEC